MLRHVPRLLRHSNARLLTSLSTVTKPTIEHIRRYGYAVLGSCEIRSLRGEINSMITRGLATANKTHVVSIRGTRTYEKGAVLPRELQTLPPGILDTIPGLHELQTDASLAALTSVFFPRRTLRQQFVTVQRASSSVRCNFRFMWIAHHCTIRDLSRGCYMYVMNWVRKMVVNYGFMIQLCHMLM